MNGEGHGRRIGKEVAPYSATKKVSSSPAGNSGVEIA